MAKIKLTCDSTCDLGDALVKKYNITVLPLVVTMDDKGYRDGIDVTPDDIYAFFEKTGKLAKSTAANPIDYQEFFEQNIVGYDAVIHFCISSEMSTTYRNACIAAEEVGNVFVIDTKNLSTGSGLLVLKAYDLAESGCAPEEIVQKINELVPKTDASFVIDSLHYLFKGGRCSALSAMGANLLKLKPCIEVRNGAMGVGKKYRGKFETVLKDYVKDCLANAGDMDLRRIFVTHAGCDENLVAQIADLVKTLVPAAEEVLVTRAGCTVSVHCGPDTLGVLFIRKNDIA